MRNSCVRSSLQALLDLAPRVHIWCLSFNENRENLMKHVSRKHSGMRVLTEPEAKRFYGIDCKNWRYPPEKKGDVFRFLRGYHVLHPEKCPGRACSACYEQESKLKELEARLADMQVHVEL